MRVVLDTNILVSCCWKSGGNEARVVELARAGAITPCVSASVISEYRDVTARGKFAKHHVCLAKLLEELLARAPIAVPIIECVACSDADDNHLLACALAAEARFVVTGNLRDFPEEWNGVRVVNARELLKLASASSAGLNPDRPLR